MAAPPKLTVDGLVTAPNGHVHGAKGHFEDPASTPNVGGAAVALEEDATFADVIRARFAAAGKGPEDAASQRYTTLLKRFRSQCAGPNVQVGTFASGGVYVTGNGFFHFITNARAIEFEALEAEQLIFRIDRLAERACDWWRVDADVIWWEPPHAGARAISRARQRRARRQQRTLATEREPHLGLAYSLLTAVYSAIDDEGLRRELASRQSAGASRIRRALRWPITTESDGRPSEAHRRDMALLREQVEVAEKLFRTAAHRNTQALYGKGMLLGVLGLAPVYLLVALLLQHGGASSAYAIAFPAGAIGAVVSVLQRMTVGKLNLDITTGKRMLVWLGAVRPWVGGVLGMALFLFIEAGLIPMVPADAEPLAFFAAVGFIAGFNERFAQDMLTRSTNSLNRSDNERTEPSRAVSENGSDKDPSNAR